MYLHNLSFKLGSLFKNFLIIFTCSTTILSCSDNIIEILTNLSQDSANEVILTLGNNNIDSSKQVQKDGTISAMGEIVQKVYVNGKEFFGNDPKLATKNITADMVDQIQVYDDMSEQAKFTKIDDGSRSKTINIKLKNYRTLIKRLFGNNDLITMQCMHCIVLNF